MNELMHALALLVGTINQHLTAVFAVGGGALFLAFVHTMPSSPPASIEDYWTWVRDALQTAIPAARATQNPTQPPAGQTK